MKINSNQELRKWDRELDTRRENLIVKYTHKKAYIYKRKRVYIIIIENVPLQNNVKREWEKRKKKKRDETVKDRERERWCKYHWNNAL